MCHKELFFACIITCGATSAVIGQPPASQLTDEAALAFVRQYCLDCHQGADAEAELDLSRFDLTDRIAADYTIWNEIARRVDEGEMPPEDGEIPEAARRQMFVAWIQRTLHQAICGDGISPGPAVLRRLNRTEYANTIRDLLGIHVDAGHDLPADGAGGEGFDNAAETLFISPIHAEKYLAAARSALGHAFKDPRGRRRIVTDEPSDTVTPSEAARSVLAEFLPRAFRRPTQADEIDKYVALFESAYDQDSSFDQSLQLTLGAVLVSPKFLFLWEEPNTQPAPILIRNHELASRLSYFLWASTPDERLFELADQGTLTDEGVLQKEVVRMLGGGENPQRGRRRRRRGSSKVRDFASSFTEQWLGTRALGREFKPDPSISRRYDSELEGGMKYEPVFFFEEILSQNRSLLNLIDSDFTYANRRLARHYRIQGEFREQPKRVELTPDSHRGGLLGMSAVLAVSSYPHRTSPVLRGKWILETLLGTPPPPPPPNVPELDEDSDTENPTSLRKRLEEHRRNPTCASCHDRIDPLGFGLENYDVLGRWRTEIDGQPIDSRGELPDGTVFEGPEQLKALLMQRKPQFARNLTAKMLGYALGRGLTKEDYCSVDRIVDQLTENDYSSHTLILGIVRSVPFRYKQGTNPELSVTIEASLSSDEQEKTHVEQAQ